MKPGLCMITAGGMMPGDYGQGPCVSVVMTVYEYVAKESVGRQFYCSENYLPLTREAIVWTLLMSLEACKNI